METSQEELKEALFFSKMRRRITDQKFSSKSIEREKRRLIERRRKSWASLGGEALYLLATRYAQKQQPAKATIAQIACLAHRLVTVLPALVLSPIAAALGGLKAQITSTDARALGNLKQKFLLHTLRQLNDKIVEIYPQLKMHSKKSSESTTGLSYLISPKIYEDLKAILTYAKNFDHIHYQTLKNQIERFEKFIELINKRNQQIGIKGEKTPIFVDPHGVDEI